MASWVLSSLVFFGYVAIVACALPRLAMISRVRAVVVAVGGALIAIAGARAETFWLQSLVLPPLCLLLAYWGTGLLWTGEMPAIERGLARFDSRLGVDRLTSSAPKWVILLLESAYVGVYPLIPIAFALHLWFSPSPEPARFWTIILITDFICFGMLPWIQTRPPRAIETAQPWTSGVRTFNLRLLGGLSVGVNTVPSGHAAEALAAALLLSDTPAFISLPVWLAAAAVSSGAVLGRYHYALDAISGWLVALFVWSILR